MAKKMLLTEEERKARRKESQEKYRHRVHRFTWQFSLCDTEAFEWLSAEEDKGAYLKRLILEDKQRQKPANME